MIRSIRLISIIAVLLAVYICSNDFLVGRSHPFNWYTAVVRLDENYRYGHDVANWHYWPINRIDRRIRRDTWVIDYSKARILDLKVWMRATGIEVTVADIDPSESEPWPLPTTSVPWR